MRAPLIAATTCGTPIDRHDGSRRPWRSWPLRGHAGRREDRQPSRHPQHSRVCTGRSRQCNRRSHKGFETSSRRRLMRCTHTHTHHTHHTHTTHTTHNAQASQRIGSGCMVCRLFVFLLVLMLHAFTGRASGASSQPPRHTQCTFVLRGSSTVGIECDIEVLLCG